MSGNNRTATPQTFGVGTQGDYRIECYVRTNVSAASERQVEAILERLSELKAQGMLTDYDVVHWPPAQRAPEGADTEEQTRSDLVATFEEWADAHGYTLRPAFQRRTVHSSLLGTEEPRETVRVPIVSLAVYEETVEEQLHGVVPYTDPDTAGQDKTFTVNDWLAAIEGERSRTATPSLGATRARSR
jgi:hypothetical protein